MSVKYSPPVFPFSALVGQEQLKKALILNAINPLIGGVLIRGDKGTAKSTAVRALARLLPEIEQVEDCVFKCNPYDPRQMCESCFERYSTGKPLPVIKSPVRVVELPLNTTEDRLVGSIDFQHTLLTGKKRFQPGLLAEANRAILYIDEVNLLEDHLVDILLDTAASGVNIVEREGVSFVHPSNYILIATMNPEEGDIRPQLLDRFGLCVSVCGLESLEQRVEVASRREQFDNDMEGFLSLWASEEENLKNRIVSAQKLLPDVKITAEQLKKISIICLSHMVSGHRGDLTIEKTARTISAFEGRNFVSDKDIREAAELVLHHRARTLAETIAEKTTQEQAANLEKESGNEQTSAQKENEKKEMSQRGKEGTSSGTSTSGTERDPRFFPGNADLYPGADTKPSDEKVFQIGKPVNVPTYDIRFARDSLKRTKPGRRTVTHTKNKTGRYVKATSQRLNNDLAFDATLRAAAPYQIKRPKTHLAVNIREPDIREKVRQKKTSNLLLFVVDASGSMGTRLMSETKGAIFSLLLEAYQKRDKVGLIAFRGMGAELLLPPTNSIELAKKLLEELPTGGKTPLASGLYLAYQVLRNQLRKEAETLPLLIIVTDGRANVGLDRNKYYEGPQFGEIYREIYDICEAIRQEKKIRSLVLDAEEKRMGSFGRSKKLAQVLDAKYYVMEELAKEEILKKVKSEKD